MVSRRPNGRPLKFKDVKTLQKKIDAYFAYCDPHIETRLIPVGMVKEMRGEGLIQREVIRPCTKYDIPNHYIRVKQEYLTDQRPYTITGLAVFLDTTRDLLLDYQNSEKFSDTIEKAKVKIHNYSNESLFVTRNPSGVIFNLKNNHGWKDTTEVITKPPETGFEDLTKEQLEQKRNELEKELNIKKRD